MLSEARHAGRARYLATGSTVQLTAPQVGGVRFWTIDPSADISVLLPWTGVEGGEVASNVNQQRDTGPAIFVIRNDSGTYGLSVDTQQGSTVIVIPAGETGTIHLAESTSYYGTWHGESEAHV